MSDFNHDANVSRAACLWTQPQHSHKQMDPELAASIVIELDEAERRGMECQWAADNCALVGQKP